MARRLRTFVHVDGTAYGPDDDVPAKVAEQIGEHAWEDDSDQDGDGEPAEVGFTDPTEPRSTAGAGEAPPRSGRGSGIEAWRAYAEQNDLDVAPDASREDIIAAAEGAGLIEREE
ncbi:hypothetical protein [Streptomyces violarus]|uniref:hypothetical protein n=1 Tax=Streptomyces violarus TaxID=67380 RepID=UPI0021C0F87E|nr:hypothetical protein [Streptomyces violarus]MCT9142941.1 hypothetical protein [Streptomyces violarus]